MVGDLVSVYARYQARGNQYLREDRPCRRAGDTDIKVTEVVFTFVVLDENGKPRALR
ncbi:hypothetical protein ABC974_17135 [Sphingomonas oligophenolica]|uniref:HotDog ACOT-type domain-containing protein n=1 Tax=Sphingomonas oligophenolica TaxID=301154 RepID=A0ABU9Y6B5_9SPHN